MPVVAGFGGSGAIARVGAPGFIAGGPRRSSVIIRRRDLRTVVGSAVIRRGSRRQLRSRSRRPGSGHGHGRVHGHGVRLPAGGGGQARGEAGDKGGQRGSRPDHGWAATPARDRMALTSTWTSSKLVRLEQGPAPFLQRFVLAFHDLPPKLAPAASVRESPRWLPAAIPSAAASSHVSTSAVDPAGTATRCTSRLARSARTDPLTKALRPGQFATRIFLTHLCYK